MLLIEFRARNDAFFMYVFKKKVNYFLFITTIQKENFITIVNVIFFAFFRAVIHLIIRGEEGGLQEIRKIRAK